MCSPRKQFAWEDALLVPFFGMGRNLFAAKTLYGLPDEVVFFGEVGVGDDCFCCAGHVEILTKLRPGATISPSFTKTVSTTPSRWLREMCSIFMASSNKSGSPACTACPGVTRTFSTRPGAVAWAISGCSVMLLAGNRGKT